MHFISFSTNRRCLSQSRHKNMLILENTTFRPDTLHALRNAFEPELVDQPSNKTQLKPGNYFQSLHVLSIISYHPSITIIFNCQFFDRIFSWTAATDRKSKNCYTGYWTTNRISVRLNGHIECQNNYTSDVNNNYSWIELWSNDGWWNATGIDTEKNECQLRDNAYKYYCCKKNQENIFRNQFEIHANKNQTTRF